MLKRPDWYGRLRQNRYFGSLSALRPIPTMLSYQEVRLLYNTARDSFRNIGYIIDAGCFLGGSTLSLAMGIYNNAAWKKDPHTPIIHTYDLFRVEPWTIGIYFDESTHPGSSFRDEHSRLISTAGDIVTVHEGDILHERWRGDPVEILFIDLAKHWTVNDHLIREFFPSLMPGKSIIIHQDYIYGEWNGWIPVTMEYLSDYFSIIDTVAGSVVFSYEKKIPVELLQRDIFTSLSISEIIRLFNQAIDRFSYSQQLVLKRSQRQLLSTLYAHDWS